MSDIQKFRKSMNGFNRHDVVTYIEYLNNKHNAQLIQLNNQLQAALAQPKVDAVVLERLQAENAQLKNEINLQQAEIAQLQTQSAAAATGEDTAYLQAENANLQALLNSLHAENAELKNQLAAAPVAAPADTESRIAAVRSEYEYQINTLKNQYEAQLAALREELANRPAAPAVMSSYAEEELAAYRRAERVERLAMERARQTRQQATNIITQASNQVQEAAKQLEDAAQNIAQQLESYKSTVINAGDVLSTTANALDAIAPDEE